MDFYHFSLLLGGIGLAAMALSGMGQCGHAARGRHHGTRMQARTTGAKGAARHRSEGGTHAGSSHGRHVSNALWALTSPKTLFSLLLGIGTTGIFFGPLLSGIPLALVSVAGGVSFDRFVVTPIWNFVLRFASTPAVTLDSCIADEATAVTSFDANGQGVVAIELDGQVVQVLGTLLRADRAAGVKVRAGQRVRIEEVNSARNCCSVSAL